jgi:hypothetical protein
MTCIKRGRRGRNRMVVGFKTPMQSVPISCELESYSGDAYSIQHYVIKFVSDFRRIGGFLRVFRFPPLIKSRFCSG